MHASFFQSIRARFLCFWAVLLLVFYLLPIGIFARGQKIIVDSHHAVYDIICPRCFKFLLKITGDDYKLKTGVYNVGWLQTYNGLRQDMLAGNGIVSELMIKPGDTIKDIKKRFSAEDILQTNVFKEPENNFILSPATISYIPGYTSDRDLLAEALDIRQKQFLKIYDACDPKLKLNFEIVASLIQKESANSEEYPYIAAVIYNRLKHDMPLQVDVYPESYSKRGLPKQPIAVASKEALQAACHPAEISDWFYYVAYKGRHVFSASYHEHKQIINRGKNVHKF